MRDGNRVACVACGRVWQSVASTAKCASRKPAPTASAQLHSRLTRPRRRKVGRRLPAACSTTRRVACHTSTPTGWSSLPGRTSPSPTCPCLAHFAHHAHPLERSTHETSAEVQPRRVQPRRPCSSPCPPPGHADPSPPRQKPARPPVYVLPAHHKHREQSHTSLRPTTPQHHNTIHNTTTHSGVGCAEWASLRGRSGGWGCGLRRLWAVQLVRSRCGVWAVEFEAEVQ